ncbi:CNNM domain-containing protein [Klenkia terrae]|uniref:CNNM domain-containing protein n=1 Tax=Klenkia terrae TaxID=1052259 RepID=UPI0036166D8D
MSSTAITLLVIAVLLVPLAGVFAAVDAALQGISRARVEALRRDDVRRAGALLEVVEDRARHVSLLLLLRIACEMTAAVLIGVILYAQFDGVGAGVVTAAAVTTVISYVLVGVGPRTLGRQHAYAIALAAAGPTRLLGRLLGPVSTLLILLGNAITPAGGSAKDRSPPRSSCASWSTWPRSAASWSPTSAT